MVNVNLYLYVHQCGWHQMAVTNRLHCFGAPTTGTLLELRQVRPKQLLYHRMNILYLLLSKVVTALLSPKQARMPPPAHAPPAVK